MGGKKHIKKFFYNMRRKVHTWQLCLVLVPLLFLTATFLRLDHIKMTELRDAVFSADEEGNDEALKENLNKLKNFTNSHIIFNIVEKNGEKTLTFGTGPFYLENSYIRAANAAIEEAESKLSDDKNPNGNIFAAASDVCKPLAIRNHWSWNSSGYLNCMTGELDKYSASSEITTTLLADIPSTELYRYEFVSPVWALSLSGLFILLSLALIVVIFTKFLIWLMIRIALFFV